MKSKKLYFIVIGILLIILAVIIWSYINRDEEVINNNNNEIIPESEISDEQMRNTVIMLYYINKDNGEIEPENRLIDTKKLMDNPYEELIKNWLEGPKSEKLKTNCSKNVKINDIYLNQDCAIVDFSKEFIDEYEGLEDEGIKVIYCIVNTLTELNEVNSVKILVEGQEDQQLEKFNLSEKYFRLEQ